MSDETKSEAVEGDYVRLSVLLNQETAAVLRECAKRHDTSATESVRRAIAILKYVDDETHAGRTIISVDHHSDTARELVLTEP